MDFSFSSDEQLFRESVRRFCTERIAPLSGSIDDSGEIPRRLIEAMGSAGILGATVSKEFGGSGASFTKAALAAEEIARAEMSMAVAVYFLIGAGWGFLLERYGTADAKKEILPDVTAGKAFLGIASTEATGGSDIASTSTTMKKQGGKFVINGTKSFISGVREAAEYGGGFVTVVSTEPGLGHKGLSLCYLPAKGLPGVSVSTSRHMGREGISNGFIKISDAEVPEHYLLGEWNKGFYYALEGFNCARPLVSAACIGAAERALEMGVDRLRKRKVFGAPIGTYEGLQFQFAEAYVRLDAARLVTYKAAWLLDRFYRGEPTDRSELNTAVAAAKFLAPTTAFDIIKDVMTWHGAYGYTKEAGLERGLRGVASYIMGAEGAMNIMKLIIGREQLGKE